MEKEAKEKKSKAPGKPKNNFLVVNFLSSAQYADKLMYVKALDTLFILRDGKYYRPLDMYTMKRSLWQYLVNFYPEVGITDSILSDIIKQIYISIPEVHEELDDKYIAFDDGLLNTDTLKLEAFHVAKVATVYFPFNYAEIEDQKNPVFDEFLRTILVEEEDTKKYDESLAVIIQEMFGYFLTPSMTAHAAFFLYGAGANGKSTLTNILIEILGRDTISAYSIESLTTKPFTSAGLVGKRLNICNEEESKYIRSDKFKALISGEVMSAERKFGNPFEFCPTTKFVFCTNRMPTFEGIDYGLKRRIKIIPFYRRISDSERDLFLIDKLKAEIPGIIKWSLEGLKRLRAQNYKFSDDTSASLRHVKSEFLHDASSAAQFFDEEYEKDDDGFIANVLIYEEYKSWCTVNNRKPFSSNKFHQELVKALDVQPGFGTVQGLTVRGKKIRKRTFDIMDPVSLETTAKASLPF